MKYRIAYLPIYVNVATKNQLADFISIIAMKQVGFVGGAVTNAIPGRRQRTVFAEQKYGLHILSARGNKPSRLDGRIQGSG